MVSATSLTVKSRHGLINTIPLTELVNLPQYKWGLLGGKILLRTKDCYFEIGPLHRAELRLALSMIEKTVQQQLTRSVESAWNLFVQHCIRRYLRDSSIEILRSHAFNLVSQYLKDSSHWRSLFDPVTIDRLQSLSQLFPFDEHIQRLRDEYEARTLSERKVFYDSIESNPLTEEQRQAVVRDNDRNLVLAAAGTGKTSVIVAKALDLIDRELTEPSNILVLAYNNAAAKELRERLARRAEVSGLNPNLQPKIMTFHALGRMILRDAGVSTHLSIFVDDPIKLKIWLTDWLVMLLKNEAKALENFIELLVEPVNPFEFNSQAEYERHIRDNEFRTLQGELVRGYQELLIANWLFLNSVSYEYEPAYITKRRIEVGFDYRPDFFLTGTNIYLEHFGISRDGSTRADIDQEQYTQSMQSKRELHKECGTKLIETYHYDWTEDNLENRLKELLQEEGVPTQSRPHNEVFQVLNKQGFIASGVEKYIKCLAAIRLEQLDYSGVQERLKIAGIAKPTRHAEFLWRMVQAYREELECQNAIDFDDMIIRAYDTIKDQSFSPYWSHILVDEFQDISGSRMALLNVLVENGPRPSLTVVGDDWQAIYRFAGGKLELTTQFDKLVGPSTKTTLQRTFRYNSSIADIAGTFVMQNPEQYKKHIKTQEIASKPEVFLLDSKGAQTENDLEGRALQVVRTIREHDVRGSIAILARYKYLLSNTKILIEPTYSDGIQYWTFHGSKGLEADYCILIGFFQGKSGFPNQNRDDAVTEALLPSIDSYPHSEERRLLYVALTRARKKCYIIADPTAPSEFVNELLSPLYEIHVGSEAFQAKIRQIYKCPACVDGYFQARSGEFGLFYTCSSGLGCNLKPRVCKVCNAPSIDSRHSSKCNNIDCGNLLRICSQCGRPMKLRSGRLGSFLGCSGYGLKKDHCNHTERLPT